MTSFHVQPYSSPCNTTVNYSNNFHPVINSNVAKYGRYTEFSEIINKNFNAERYQNGIFSFFNIEMFEKYDPNKYSSNLYTKADSLFITKLKPYSEKK